MRFFYSSALGVLLCLANNNFGETAQRVALTARIVSERYCEANEDFGSLLVKFEVTLTNNGDDPITINPPFYPVLRIAPSVHDLLTGRNGSSRCTRLMSLSLIRNRRIHCPPP